MKLLDPGPLARLALSSKPLLALAGSLLGYNDFYDVLASNLSSSYYLYLS